MFLGSTTGLTTTTTWITTTIPPMTTTNTIFLGRDSIEINLVLIKIWLVPGVVGGVGVGVSNFVIL